MHGELGVGKTTFVRYLINTLQKENKLKLPDNINFFDIYYYEKYNKIDHIIKKNENMKDELLEDDNLKTFVINNFNKILNKEDEYEESLIINVNETNTDLLVKNLFKLIIKKYHFKYFPNEDINEDDYFNNENENTIIRPSIFKFLVYLFIKNGLSIINAANNHDD